MEILAKFSVTHGATGRQRFDIGIASVTRVVMTTWHGLHRVKRVISAVRVIGDEANAFVAPR